MSLKSYDTQGRNWMRRQIWNKISQRIFGVHNRRAWSNRPAIRGVARNMVVLYLSTEEDLDWPEMKKWGFQRHNCWAVNKSEDVIGVLRGRGIPAVAGQLHDVLNSWTTHVDVIWADTCDALSEKKTIPFVESLVHASCVDGRTLLAVNLVAGHDKWSHEWREFCVGKIERGEYEATGTLPTECGQHRAFALYGMAHELCLEVHDDTGTKDVAKLCGGRGVQSKSICIGCVDGGRSQIIELEPNNPFFFNRYVTHVTPMDCGIFRLPKIYDFIDRAGTLGHRHAYLSGNKSRRLAKTRRHVAAVRAINTMRLSGVLQ